MGNGRMSTAELEQLKRDASLLKVAESQNRKLIRQGNLARPQGAGRLRLILHYGVRPAYGYGSRPASLSAPAVSSSVSHPKAVVGLGPPLKGVVHARPAWLCNPKTRSCRVPQSAVPALAGFTGPQASCDPAPAAMKSGNDRGVSAVKMRGCRRDATAWR